MQKRSSKTPAKKKDINETAHSIMRRVTEEIPAPATDNVKNPAAVALGRLGGLKGGKARAATLTAEERKKIAQGAAKARWTNERGSNS